MSEPLRLLQVEDSEGDAAIIVRLLERAGYDVTWRRVESEAAMRATLAEAEWDLIISDYSMPQFNAPAALAVLKDSGLDLPFIVVSGNIGEDIAVNMMRAGAQDFLLKDKLARLAPAVERELAEADSRRKRRKAERAMLEGQAQLHGIIDSAMDAIITIDEAQRVVLFNPAAEVMFQCSAEQASGQSIEGFIPERLRARHRVLVGGFGATGATNRRMGEAGSVIGLRADGSEFPLEASISQVTVQGRRYFTAIMRDITERQRAMDDLEYANARLIKLSRQILEVQEAERREIARELHDEIGQTLTAIKINVQGVQRLVLDEAGRKRLEEVVDLAGQTLDQVRGMSLNLRPSQLDDLGLEAAVRWNAGRQAAATGMKLHFHSALENERLPGAVETACFRVSQEALTNVVRHAAADNVWVTLAVEAGKVELTVRDDGCGFDPVAKRQRANGGASFGLLGMEERTKLTGGNLQIEAVAGSGTILRAWFPIGTDEGDKQ